MNKQIVLIFASLIFQVTHIIHAMKETPRVFSIIYSNIRSNLSTQQQPIEALHTWLERHPQEINIRNFEGRTPLMHAIRNMRYKAIDVLLKHPLLNPNMHDHEGRTALHYAVSSLMAYDPQTDDTQTYVPSRCENVIAKILCIGILPSLRDNHGNTALQCAHENVQNFLKKCLNILNDALLLQGARRGDWRAVQLAMRDGADINAQDLRCGLEGNTAAHYAVNHVIKQLYLHPQENPDGILNFLRLILTYGPSLNIKNKYGLTAVDEAKGSLYLTLIIRLFLTDLESPEQRLKQLLADERYRN